MTGSLVRRAITLAALVAAPLAVPLALAGPADADVSGTTPQAIEFTSEPITDAIVGYRYNYAVTAESTSGLPVVLSTDPASDVCEVGPEPPFVMGNVVPIHAGTCTVYADQPGNDEYAPAPRISLTFEIGKEATTITPLRAGRGVFGLSTTTFSATLTRRGWFGPGYGAEFPYLEQRIVFRVGNKVMCSADTVPYDDGSFFGSAIATCKAKLGLDLALTKKTFTATYDGSRDYAASTATRKLG